jgi:hypothetical protein
VKLNEHVSLTIGRVLFIITSDCERLQRKVGLVFIVESCKCA